MGNKRTILAVLLCVAIGTGALREAVGAETAASAAGRAKPCYVVIAVDVSGSMERADAPTEDARGRRWTLRDEGQLALLQLLPYVYSDLYVGVCHFSDRVRYMLPSEGTGSVLPWGGNYLDEAACRNLVRPAEFMSSFRTNIPRGLDWAMTRIQAARARYGDGPGKVLLLSHGDPQDSSRELEGGGPLLGTGARLAEQNINVYPIIINEASYRPGVESGELSSSERAAEGVMVSLAAMTGGRAYRIGPEMGFADILMDAFGLGTPIAGDLQISPYDWAVMVVGSTPDSVRVGPEATTWQVDPASEIRSRTVASTQWPATILRRPARNDAIARLWQGRWELRHGDGPTRVYRIPDFLLETEANPGFPWWIHQRGQLTARLFDRHNGQGYIPEAGGPSGSDGLAIRFIGQTSREADAFRVDDGQWTVPTESYTTETFRVETSGAYALTCELLYVQGDVNTPLIGLTKDVQIHPTCVGIDVVSTSGETLGTLTDTVEPVALDIEGGRPVVFQAGARGPFNAQPLSGTLHLAPLTQATWTLGKATDADPAATNSITLPEDEEGVTGWVEMEVQTPLGPRQFRLPDFELAYQPAPIRLTCSFGDTDRALWVGELQRQLLTVSAFPVFDRYVNATRQRFPETLANVTMRTVDLKSGTVQVTRPGGRLVETPKPTGAKGRTLAAAYSLEAEVPIPPSDRCEINVEGAIADLQGAVKTYNVVDPVTEGLFTWSVQQGTRAERSEPVSDVLYLGEPVQFAAQWRADQNVTGVRFEIPRPRPNGSFFIDLPVTSGAEQASIEQTIPPLALGRTYPVYVHVTRRVSAEAPPVTIKLLGGQFAAEDRRLVFEELSVGAEAARDITCHAWEPVAIPLQIAFSGYLAGNPQHAALIEQYKSRCTLTVTSSTGQTDDITAAIEWTALAADSAPAGQATRCRLEGRVPYTPQTTGRATVELKLAPAGAPPQTDTAREAYGHLAVRAPRLTIGIHRLTPSGEVPVFDSQAWAQGTGGLSPVTAGFSTRLRARIRATEERDVSAVSAWNVTLQVLHCTTTDGQWVIDSSEELPLTGRDVLVREMQVTRNGQYALEIVGRDAASGQVLTRLRTPVMMTIQQHEVDPVLAPPAWITAGVRHWPFAYRVTLRGASGDPTDAALAAQFQLPSDDPVWLEASAQVMQSDTAAAQEVRVTSPDVLPVLGTLRDGAVRFRLSSQGLELLNWDYPNVRVLPPVLEKLALGRLPNGRGSDAVGREIAWDGAMSLWARPVYRVAPELAGQWVREKTVVYLWPDGGDANQVPVALLQQSGSEDGVPGKTGGRVFVIEGDAADQAVEVLPRRARWSFWGWPKEAMNRRYALVATAVYRPEGPAAPSAGDGQRTIAEWTEVYSIDLTLPRVIPWCWWFLAALVVYLVLVALLKLFARRPDRLGLDMRLQEHVAVVDPAGPESPVSISLCPTSVAKEIELQKRYLLGCSQVLRPLAGVIAPVKVLLRRCLFPRRWAWASITPKTGGNVRHVRLGLVCVSTSPFARTGHGWSSEVGSFDLPGDGQSKSITLELPYQMEGMTRSMRVSVRIRKMAPGGANHAAEETV